ncbi:DUF2950 domain-containing protein [Chitinibacter sp. S2-10]|uniref:DUF2950 domain-containing protein n=1 Tax=Chitinibacter sp. S2-10 TaxID=3373597 RepID=UPI003977B1CB
MKIKYSLLLALSLSAAIQPALAGQLFASPEAAGEALVLALENKDVPALEKIFGKKNRDLIVSGDSVADAKRYEEFVSSYRAKHQWTAKGKTQVLEIGDEQTPFAIPVLRDNGGWVFAATTGRAELLTRRIGLNELSAIESLKTFTAAQQEYYLMQPTGSALLHYADRFISSEGQRDGLYWPDAQDKPSSPLGSFFAAAAQEGYSKRSEPYHGYFFKILKEQGAAAKGGAYRYVEKDKMFGGFAILAWPASYGRSGVMSFITNQDGVIYQRNLGKGTAEVAKKINSFNPEKGWEAVE